MNQKIDNWNALYEKYPDLFRNLKNKWSPMAFGIECGTGWYSLINNLCYRISQHNEHRSREEEYTAAYFDQIKEKFGGLRAYINGGDDYIHGAVAMAEEMSYTICEVCGNNGSPNDKGWISTRCKEHRNS